jgi:N-acetylglutamate synthase-like GNAT family acetyltransferase
MNVVETNSNPPTPPPQGGRVRVGEVSDYEIGYNHEINYPIVNFAIDRVNMIRQCEAEDFEKIYEVINDAAARYEGVIPPDRWKEPYMSREDLKHEIDDGVVFWGYYEEDKLIGVMGIQPVQDVTLIRHAYVRTTKQNQGIAKKLLSRLRKEARRPILIGTWAAAVWAIRFYEKHGFKLVSQEEKDRLLTKYWSIPERQISTSVVLAEQKWFEQKMRMGPL